MTIRSPRSLMLAAVLSSLTLPVFAAAPASDPVVATVNGKEIHRSTVIEAQQSIPQARQLPLEQIYDQLLDQVITNELVLEQAKKQKLEDDAQVKAAFKDAQDAILRRAWVAKKVESDVTEPQVKSRFEELLKTAQPQEQVHARHILVASEDAAKAVLADLKSGVAFEDEAKAKTTEPQGKTNGGDLGYFTREEMVKEFSDVAFTLKPGEVSQTPVKTNFGFHIIKVEDRRMAPLPTYDEAKGQVRQQLAQEDIAKVVDSLKKGAAVKRFKLDGTPAEAPKPAPAK